jgi:hypothetical protein
MAVNFTLGSELNFTLNDEVVNFKLNVSVDTVSLGFFRLLETGFYRLLEDGSKRLLE